MDVGRPTGATPPVRRETLVEIAGYAGAAAAVAGTVIAFAQQTDLSDGAALAITLVVTAVLVAAGLAIGDRPPDEYQRLRSVLWFAAVESFGFASGIFWASVVDLGAKTSATLSGVVTAAFALILWVMLRRSLQQIAFFLAAVGTIAALAVPTSFVSTSDLNGPLLVIWVSGLAWFVAGTAEIVRPARTARVLGAVVALVSTLELFGPSFSLALTLTSITSLVLLAVGDLKDDRAVAGLGIVGILLAVAVAVARAVGDSQGAAVAAIAIGLILLGGAIAVARMSAPADAPAIPGAEPPGGDGEEGPAVPPPPAAY
jgi:hypothetical protein